MVTIREIWISRSPTAVRCAGVERQRRGSGAATCRVYSSRRQSKIAIVAEAQLGIDVLRQTERGFDLQGEQLFGSLPGEFT